MKVSCKKHFSVLLVLVCVILALLFFVFESSLMLKEVFASSQVASSISDYGTEYEKNVGITHDKLMRKR